jgi:hypothetical protein
MECAALQCSIVYSFAKDWNGVVYCFVLYGRVYCHVPLCIAVWCGVAVEWSGVRCSATQCVQNERCALCAEWSNQPCQIDVS